jgi:hypothetical protein
MRSLFDMDGEPIQVVACNHCGTKIGYYTRDQSGAIRAAAFVARTSFSSVPPFPVICPSRACERETDILAIDYFDWQEVVDGRKTGVAFQYSPSFP